MFEIKKAARKISKMRLGLFGASGSGKTYSSLLLAKGLTQDWNKIVVIDTESGSADLYSHLGEFNTLTLEAPFTPYRYIEALEVCEKSGAEVIVIDSISHEWEGVGGCLDIHSRLGGKFEHWAKVTPMHRKFIDAILQSSCHVITCGRSKIDYAFESKSENNGRGRVEKVGLKAITREGFDYELTIAFNLSQEHLCSIDKDRTSIFKDSIPFLMTEKVGEKIREWNLGGSVHDPKPQLKADIIKMITVKLQEGMDKEELLKRLSIESSKDVFAEENIENLNDWVAILNE
jgi:hypothetical protein